ncbi:MAG: patatin-like phospholipase family protein [Gemmatimonadetes bacterium]|nr:patatin-like phospholipase family protein [Gemmatimonadota bacterium]MYG84004.1 patatin-like phospholipase family protein [Gemmatimonadota bacterium]MYJ88367.1 patatin-like phospholipase family protein [Gemmatimonadota bacterium]
MPDSKKFYVLALDGGGTRGVYSAQLLSKLETTLGRSIRDCFHLIAGSSTGSIVAGAAATGIKMEKTVGFFEKSAKRVFKKRFYRCGLTKSKYRNEQLREVITDSLPSITLGEIETPLMITGSDTSTGKARVFKSRYLKQLGEPYVMDGNLLLSKVILASCSAPTFFDPTDIDGHLVVDGGLWANNPSIISLSEAISKFNREVKDVKILSIGTGQKTESIYARQKHWGLLTGWGGVKLVTYFLDLQSQASKNMAELVLGNNYLRLNPSIGDWNLDDTEHLENLRSLADMDYSYNVDAIKAFTIPDGG